MRRNDPVRFFLTSLCLFAGVRPQPGAAEGPRLGAEEAKHYYDQTYAAKGDLESKMSFGFIEGVPVLAKTKTVSADVQCFSAITLHAYMRHTNEVAMTYARESDQLRKTTPGASAISRIDFERALKKAIEQTLGAKTTSVDTVVEVAQDVPHAHDPRPPHTHNKTPLGDDTTWAGIKAIVPNIEELGRKAGYIDIQHECTPGIAMCLFLQGLLTHMTPLEAITQVLRDRHVLVEAQIAKPLDWKALTRAIERGTPLVVHDSNEMPYLVVGYSELEDGKQLLFAFAPDEVERGVHFGGRQMTERRFNEVRKEQGSGLQLTPFWFDLISTHKQNQLPGFCALEFDPRLRYSFISNPRIDVDTIKAISQNAWDLAITESKGEKE